MHRINIPLTSRLLLCVCFGCLSIQYTAAQRIRLPPRPSIGPKDTIPMAIIPDGNEWILHGKLPDIAVRSTITIEAYRKWAKLERAVIKTYPYAKSAGKVILDVRSVIDTLKTTKAKRAYFRTREKELKEKFTYPLKRLSRYQGGVLIKLINRETSNTCYELLRQYKGGVAATMWELVAGMFDNSLKSKYEPEVNLEDFYIETIMQRMEREYDYGK